MNDFWTLLWKEYRNNTHLIIVGLTVLFLPVFIVMSFVYGGSTDRPFLDVIAMGLILGAIGGLILSQFLLLCLGGHLIGGERSTRSFEFLFNQPVSRIKMIMAKLVFALLWTAIAWGLVGLMVLIGIQIAHPESGIGNDEIAGEIFAEIAAAGAMLFGASWLASNKVDSSVLAIAIGAITAGAFFLFLQFISTRIDSRLTIGGYDWTRIVAFSLLSVIATSFGVWIFVRRKTP